MDIKFQMKNAVIQYGEDTDAEFSDAFAEKVANYMINEYSLDDMTEEELDEFVDSSALEESISFFWNDYLYEEEGE